VVAKVWLYKWTAIVIVVDSNDSLYGSDKKFIAEISKIADTIINLLLEHLKELSTTEEVR